MLNIMGEPKQQLELVSAYFVPTQKGTDYLTQLSKNQVKVRVLTNSFVANDVALVHAFYKEYRHDLLKSGVKLYEFKPYIERNKRTWYEVVTGNLFLLKVKTARVYTPNSSTLMVRFLLVHLTLIRVQFI